MSFLLDHAGFMPLLAAMASLVWLHRRERARIRDWRAAFFSRSLGLFDTYRVTQDDLAYPVLKGTYRGYQVRLEPVVDDMAWRKIPSLWLKVTVLCQLPYEGVFDFIARPRGVEFYSPSGELEHHLPVPPEWPQDARLCSDAPACMPPAEIMAAHMPLFADPQMKEMLVTPKGARVVRQIWQADRAHYLALRQAKFAEAALDAELAKSLLDAAIGIAESLAIPDVERLVA
ncbi:MAG TPA: hypothetical protein VHT51_11140 [Micropepsaceae bacterium]|jgi:hypothetical protein|nr:hypothetical protein [Micropepsaceae bacterium]